MTRPDANTHGPAGWLLLAFSIIAAPLHAQTFSSGSTGALGALNPAGSVTIPLPPDGVLNYTTINIPSGVVITFQPNAANTPVTMLATSDVTMAGTISVNGANGVNSNTVAAPGGPGGFAGGLPGNPGSAGLGPGGGPPASISSPNAVFVLPTAFVSQLPLFGGSGGGGGRTASGQFAGGGGGGGAIVIASSTRITITGLVRANGGAGGLVGNSSFNAGGGSGGVIRLVAPQVTNSGTLSATGGTGGPFSTQAAMGRIRIESFSASVGNLFSGQPTPSVSTAPGPVLTASVPSLMNLPTLRITSVGGTPVSVTPTGFYATADLSLPAGTSNPVPVVLTATNTPTGLTFTVTLVPRSGATSSFSAPADPGGTFTSSTYTANVTFPSSQVSALYALGSFTLPQLASAMPTVDGEQVERLVIAAAYGEPSALWLVTDSGKQRALEDFSSEEQSRILQAIHTVRP